MGFFAVALVVIIVIILVGIVVAIYIKGGGGGGGGGGNGGVLYYLSYDGWIYKAINAEDLKPVRLVVSASAINQIAYNPKDGLLYGVDPSGGIYSMLPGPNSAWNSISQGDNAIDIAFDNDGNMYGVRTPYPALYTKGIDYSGSPDKWTIVNNPENVGDYLRISFDSIGGLYALNLKGDLYYSSNPKGAATQQKVTDNFLGDLAVDQVTGYVYATGLFTGPPQLENHIYYSVNTGNSPFTITNFNNVQSMTFGPQLPPK